MQSPRTRREPSATRKAPVWRQGALALAALILVSGCAPAGAPPAGRQAHFERQNLDLLPGPTYRWDYQAFDPASRLLYLADLGQNQVVVFNPASDQVVAQAGPVASVHGVALAPDLHLVLATADTTNQVVAIDTRSFKTVGVLPVGSAPNGIAYADRARRFFVTDGAGTGDTVIQGFPLDYVGQVQLGTGIGNTIYDAASGLIYVTLGVQSQLVAVDPETLAVVRRYPIAACSWPHGVVIDDAHTRALVACAFSSRLKVLDLKSGRVTQTFVTGQGPDVVAIDPGLGRAYVASDSGRLAVFDVSSARVHALGLVPVEPGAHTVGVDTVTHQVFLPLASKGPNSTLVVLTPKLA